MGSNVESSMHYLTFNESVLEEGITKMPLDTITSKLTSEGFFIIQVESNNDKDDARKLVFVGNIDMFIQATKALGQDIVFITTRILDKSDFLYEIDEDYQEDDEDIDAEPIQLSSILPSLNKFESYIGKECVYKLALRTPYTTLEFYTQEPWWDEFFEMAEEAKRKIEDDARNKRLAQLTQKIATQKELLDRLKKLINDNDFAKLPTQKAMLAYAMDKIPELEDIDYKTLQTEIQTLSAKLAAKGLSRKR